MIGRSAKLVVTLVSPLGVDRFGQTGDLPDLYRTYRLDADAIIDVAAELFIRD